MLNLNFNVPETTSDGGALISVIENLRQSLQGNYCTITLIFLMLLFINIKTDNIKKCDTCIFYVFNGLLAFLWLLSEGFRLNDTTVNLYCTNGQVVKSVIYVIGAMHLLNCIGNIVYNFLNKNFCKTYTSNCNKLKIFLTYFICVFAIWIPNTVISCPASIGMDVWDSLYQYFGRTEFTAHHPPVFTALIGKAAKLGLALGDVNIGFFAWILVQTIIGALIMAYVLYTMRIMEMPRWVVNMTLIIVAISPCYTSYVATIIKDTPYSFAVLLYIVELIYIHLDWEKYWKSWWHVMLYTIANMGVLLFRHNGKYIVYIMLVYLLIKFIMNKANVSRRTVVKAIVLLMLPLVISKMVYNCTSSHYNVTVQQGESFRESISLPLQQTARYAKYYEEETPEEEKAIIDKVVDYYALAGVYEPAISDPVKGRFHYYATSADWINYFKVWFRQFTRHPMTYFEATMNQNYYLVYPFKENSRFYYSTYVDYFYDHDFMDELGAAQNMTFDKANNVRIEFYKLLNSFPLTGMFSNLAVYNIILSYLIIFAIKDKKKGFLWITIPIVLSDLVIIAGPAIYDNIRYSLPVIYMMPLAVAYFIYIHNKETVEPGRK
jgi:hypothetical protein